MNVTLEKAVLGGEQELKYEAKARYLPTPHHPAIPLDRSVEGPWSLPMGIHSAQFTHKVCVYDD